MALRTTLTGLTLLALLAGCSSSPSDSSSQQRTGNCNVSHLQNTLGEQITGDIVDELKEQSNASVLRVLAPGDAATMDHNPQRLNIDIDETEVIVRLSCG